MNINNCDYSTRNKNHCSYNLDCVNDKKTNNVHSPCPAKKNNNIINCDKNNNSKVCPVMLCNNKKADDINKKLLERNFPTKKMCVLPDYRGEFNVCSSYVSLDTGIKCPRKNSNTFNPGKGSGVGFLSNIDVDSNLKIGYKSTLCPENKYIQPICDRIIVDNPYILDNPTCQNYKYYQFPEKSENYKTKCNTNVGVDLSFNINSTNESCNFELLKQSPRVKNTNKIMCSKYKSDMINNGKLQIGPERQNHNIENVWSNITRRKNI